MIHRYLRARSASSSSRSAVLAWRNRRDRRAAGELPIALVLLVIFQGLLGMWTVTLLLKPLDRHRRICSAA